MILGHRWEKEKRIPCGHDIGLQNIKSLHITLGPKVSNIDMVQKKKKKQFVRSFSGLESAFEKLHGLDCGFRTEWKC